MAQMDCIAALKALGEANRLRILRLLLKSELDVNAIAETLAISQYNVSKHLRVLREAGFLEIKKQGQQRFYSLTPSLRTHLARNSNILRLDCCTFDFDKLPQ
jgi:DNA-binding transcriptional ArsR family regulator